MKRDGVIPEKYYVCQKEHITSSKNRIEKCPICAWAGEHDEYTSLDNAIQGIQKKNENKTFVQTVAQQRHEDAKRELIQHLARGNWIIKGAESLTRENPIYYDRTGAWWVWNPVLCVWEEKDETDILNLCRYQLELLGDTSIKHGKKLLDGLKQIARERNPKEPPLNLVQFGTTFYDIKTGETKKSSPEYFSTNTIPWEVGETSETPVMDELIKSWVDEEHVQTMYELLAYCTYRGYPIHRIFCFVGSGANGKTRFIKIIEKFIGDTNKSSVSLKKLIGNNFAIYPLYRKLVCFVGETTHHKLESTDILKALSGEDPVDFEAKGRTGFTGTSYAKLIVGTNVLPPSVDTSVGWYRRWFIVQFPNEFHEGEDVLKRIPEREFSALARKCVTLLPKLLARGSFSSEGTVQQRQERYVEQSNPIKSFLEEGYERDPTTNILYGECYLDYLAFLVRKRLRRVNKRDFTSSLEDEGLEVQRKSVRDGDSVLSIYVIWGVKKRNVGIVGVVGTSFKVPPYKDFEILSDLRKAATMPTMPTFAKNSENNKEKGENNNEIEKVNREKNIPFHSSVVGVSLELFKEWIKQEPGCLKPLSEIEKNWPVFYAHLNALKQRRELYEPKPGMIGVLE